MPASWLGISLVILCLTIAGPADSNRAHADTTLSVVGPGELSELAHHREIRFSPHAIEVAETITLANSGGRAVEAIYAFSLPAQAAVYELAIETAEGAKSRYGVVDAQAATRLVADPAQETSPDMGLLRMVGVHGVGEAAERRYELRVFPVPAQKICEVMIRWRSPVSLVAGSYSVRIPGRGGRRRLARSEIQLRTTMASAELYGGGAAIARNAAKNKRYQFFEPAEGDLVIQARSRVSRPAAYAEVALYPLTADTGVAAIRVVLPEAARGVKPSFGHALILVDVSRSMGQGGREAASKLVDSLLAEIGAGTQVEAILFHRSATQVLGEMRAGTSSVRSQIVQAIRSASDKNGSDLKSALLLGRRVLEEALKGSEHGRPNDTLIAIVSDGILPADLKGPDAVLSLGPDLMRVSRILSAVLVPANAPLPASRKSALGTLAYRGRGRVAALHYAEAAQQGTTLLRELAQPQPLETLEVQLDRGQWVGANLLGPAAPGSSVSALGYYQGGSPKRVTVRAYQAGKRLILVAQKLPRTEAKRMAQMTLAATSPDSFPGTEQAAENRRAFVRVAARLGVVTEASAGVAIHRDDGFGNDRLALAARWGGQYYRRLPPPAERAATRGAKAHSFRKFEITTPRDGINSHEKTGKLDRKIIRRRVRSHVMPLARGCYQKLLRRDHQAHGSVRLRMQVSRGEVHHADLPEISFSLEPIRDCIIDAAYALPIPRVRQGSDPEQVIVVNYPLRFRLHKAGKGKVEEGTASVPTGLLDTSDPLSGLPE